MATVRYLIDEVDASIEFYTENLGFDWRCCTALAESKIRLLCWLRYVRP